MDKIRINQLACYGYHGVFPEEAKLGQRFYVDVELGLNLRPAGQSDNLERTVNYAEVAQSIRHIVEHERYQLIESLAERIASMILETYTIVSETTVRIVKPHPPVNLQFAGVSVEIYRKRE